MEREIANLYRSITEEFHQSHESMNGEIVDDLIRADPHLAKYILWNIRNRLRSAGTKEVAD